MRKSVPKCMEIMIIIYFIAGSARGQYEANPVFRLLTPREGKMGSCCPRGIARLDPALERQGRQKTDKLKKTYTTLVDSLCYKHG